MKVSNVKSVSRQEGRLLASWILVWYLESQVDHRMRLGAPMACAVREAYPYDERAVSRITKYDSVTPGAWCSRSTLSLKKARI
jgi:hypothetical protein